MINLNPKIKSETGAVVIAMILVVGVLTFSLSSHLQTADAKKDKDKYDELRETIRKKAEATAGISDRGYVDIVGSNANTSSAIAIDGADGVNGTGISVRGADGVSVKGPDGVNGTDGVHGLSMGQKGADGVDGTGADSIGERGADG